MFERRIPLPSHTHGLEPVVALFRTWHAAVQQGTNPRAAMAATLDHLRPSPELVAACDSFFALTEACLDRPLLPSPAGASTLSSDEQALLETLRQIPALLALGPNAAIPHGLPGALQWAAFAVLRALCIPADPALSPEPPPPLCPFSKPAGAGSL
jgi:hypothetical protein